MENRFGIFACGDIGKVAVQMFIENKSALKFVLLDTDDFWERNCEIISILKYFPETEIYYYKNDEQLVDICSKVDLVILAYWGKIVKEPLLYAPRIGFLNCHTGMLPYGKGVHAHAWSIIEGTPFGVTLMMIDEGLDTGEIIAQREIPVSMEDTGKTLYFNAIRSLKELMMEKREQIINLRFNKERQRGGGTSHKRSELEIASKIDLDKEYVARDLINLLRAKTFDPFPAAWFEDGNEEWEIRVEVKRKKREKVDYKSIRIID